MPEIVFAVIGPTATGLAGISPDAPDDVVETLPRLPKTLEWITMMRVPVLQNEIMVRLEVLGKPPSQTKPARC